MSLPDTAMVREEKLTIKKQIQSLGTRRTMCIAGQRAPLLVARLSHEELFDVPERKPRKSKQVHPRLVVQHNYHDRANEADDESQSSVQLFHSSGSSPSFPYKLFDMLSRVEAEGHANIVSWSPHGRSFVVHKPEAFKALLGYYFSVSKIASFQRQLNLYGFIRLTRGPDRGGYYHEFFLRGKPSLLAQIHRMKVKGTGVRARSNPAEEPDLWGMPWVGSAEQSTGVSMAPQTTAMHASEYSIISNDESEHDMEPVPMEQPPQSDIVTGWGMPFHYLDLAAPENDGLTPFAATSAPQNHLFIEDPLMNDADLERELDDLLGDDGGDFDLLAQLEHLVGDDHTQNQFQW